MQCNYHFGTFQTVLITLLAGIAIGAWNGYWVAYCGIPSFIVTLASMLVFKGLTLLIGNGRTIGPMSERFCALGKGYVPRVFGKNLNGLTIIITLIAILAYIFLEVKRRKSKIEYNLQVGPLKTDIVRIAVICVVIMLTGYMLALYKGIPYAVLLLIFLTVVFTIVAKSTAIGRTTYAIGGNKEVAQLSGISVKKSTMFLFVQMGFITAVASILYLGRIRQATPQAGTGFEFSAITGCVVGGASTMGGIGTVFGAVIGTLFSGLITA